MPAMPETVEREDAPAALGAFIVAGKPGRRRRPTVDRRHEQLPLAFVPGAVEQPEIGHRRSAGDPSVACPGTPCHHAPIPTAQGARGHRGVDARQRPSPNFTTQPQAEGEHR